MAKVSEFACYFSTCCENSDNEFYTVSRGLTSNRLKDLFYTARFRGSIKVFVLEEATASEATGIKGPRH
jgi:hypothetical protein